MKGMKSVLFIFAIGSALSAQAQIYINTGNPNMERYKQKDPNAVIWDGKSALPKSGEVAPANNNNTVTNPVVTQPVKPAVTNNTLNNNNAPITASKPANINDMPPNAEPGKCYARCFTADQYEFKEEQVIDKPASVKMKNIPATYKTVYDTVVVKAAYKKTLTVPAVYDTISEEVVTRQATTKWVQKTADAECLSANPKDCQVMCLVEIPAEKKTITRRVEKVPASTTTIDIPATIKVVPRKVIDVPARQEKEDVPATYKTIMKKNLVKKGGFQEWHEILCSQDLTSDRIMRIQTSLKNEGYDPGVIDNKFGPKTKEALLKFQQDKGLPIGNLNMETLKALGVN
jgi:hypothetical protein